MDVLVPKHDSREPVGKGTIQVKLSQHFPPVASNEDLLHLQNGPKRCQIPC